MTSDARVGYWYPYTLIESAWELAFKLMRTTAFLKIWATYLGLGASSLQASKLISPASPITLYCFRSFQDIVAFCASLVARNQLIDFQM